MLRRVMCVGLLCVASSLLAQVPAEDVYGPPLPPPRPALPEIYCPEPLSVAVRN